MKRIIATLFPVLLATSTLSFSAQAEMIAPLDCKELIESATEKSVPDLDKETNEHIAYSIIINNHCQWNHLKKDVLNWDEFTGAPTPLPDTYWRTKASTNNLSWYLNLSS